MTKDEQLMLRTDLPLGSKGDSDLRQSMIAAVAITLVALVVVVSVAEIVG